MLATTLYDDDFLTNSMNTSSLYDKSGLDLSFTDNNNGSEQKVSGDSSMIPHSTFFLRTADDEASPNLDFLKLGSPDLEQIFMNIESGNDLLSNEAITTISPTSKPSSSSSFDMDEDLIGAECYLTDALQHLHDKQTNSPVNTIPLLDVPIKLEEEDTLPITCIQPPVTTATTLTNVKNNTASSNLLLRQRKQYGVKMNLQKALDMPQLNSVRNDNFDPKENCRNLLIHHRQPHHQQQQLQQQLQQREQQQQKQQQQQQRKQQQQHRQHQQQRQKNFQQQSMANTMQMDSSQRTLQHLTEQIVLNNQALIRHQEQQELVLLQQAINYQKQQQANHLIPPSPLPSSHQLQHHKMLQHQMIQHAHQQQSNHFQQQHNINDRNTIKRTNNTYHHMNDTNISASIDENTLKMFVENPHLAPLNLDVQDLVKRERKKLRNRIASSKCRKRKLEREGKLEDKVKILGEKNIELNAVANALKQQICDLKQRVMEHVNEGCHIIMP